MHDAMEILLDSLIAPREDVPAALPSVTRSQNSALVLPGPKKGKENLGFDCGCSASRDHAYPGSDVCGLYILYHTTVHKTLDSRKFQNLVSPLRPWGSFLPT